MARASSPCLRGRDERDAMRIKILTNEANRLLKINEMIPLQIAKPRGI